MSQLVQVAGAIAILVAFAAAQLRLLTVESRLYLVLNLVGSLVLGVDAWHERQWGFLLLEGVWCLDPQETFGPGQLAEIDRVYRDYPHLNDDAFVAQHRDDWLRA